MSQPVAIVTGAASGMGLALTKHLVSQGWKVGMADINQSRGHHESSLLGPAVMFRQLDIADYYAQARFFKDVFNWAGGRLDFLAANAGIGEQMKLFAAEQEVDAEGLPKRLETRALDVDLRAVIEGIWLFRYFHRKGTAQGQERVKGKIVVTASSAGL